MKNIFSSKSHLTASRPSENGPSRCLHCWARSLSVCVDLDPAELHDFEKAGLESSFAPKKTMFSENESVAKVYSLTQGVVRLYKLLPDGRRHIIGFALPGDLLGVAHSERYSFSADAITPVVACQYSREIFNRFVEGRPGMLRRIIEFESRELDLARNQMLVLGTHSAEQKIALFLIGWRDRLARLGEIPKTLPLPMRRRDIADFLGLTIETVSRTLTRLEREKLIVNVPRGVRILNLARTEALASA